MILLKISLRNLLRHKKRTVMLSLAIAFGMMVLVLINSFTAGIYDVLVNKVIVRRSGHISVNAYEKSGRRGVIRDKARFLDIITNTIDVPVEKVDEMVGMRADAIGNGAKDMLFINGLELESAEKMQSFIETHELVDGKLSDFTNKEIMNPVIIYDKKAEDLNVRVGDIIKVRFRSIYRQMQTERFTVVALLKSDSFLFSSVIAYLDAATVKEMTGMKPHESGPLRITIKDLKSPRLAIKQADKLYKAFEPAEAYIYASVKDKPMKSAVLMGFLTNEEYFAPIKSRLKIVDGAMSNVMNLADEYCMISATYADELGIKPGDEISSIHSLKYGGESTNSFVVAALYESEAFDKRAVLMNEYVFHAVYNYNLPLIEKEQQRPYAAVKDAAVLPSLSKEWERLPRSSTSEEHSDKREQLMEMMLPCTIIDIQTMFETASSILEFEKVLNLIGVIAVLVLFFIILVGVVNTLRMTVLERTREIGTTRAIGMKRSEVRNVFILETFFMSLFATAVGVFLSFIAIYLISMIDVNLSNRMTIFLVDGHLHFVPKLSSILTNAAVILIITVITAYFPARRAAKMRVADALRHFE